MIKETSFMSFLMYESMEYAYICHKKPQKNFSKRFQQGLNSGPSGYKSSTLPLS